MKMNAGLNCEVSIIRAKNMEFLKKTSSGDFFVRCYISAGKDQRAQLNTTEIPSSLGDDLFWNESFSLECLGTESSMQSLKQGNVVFELRWRCTSGSFLGRLGGSKLLGRAEIPWKNVFESETMEIETWAHMITKDHQRDVKPPKVQVRMKVGAAKMIEKTGQEDKSSCGCRKGCGCKSLDYVDYDLSALSM